VTVELLHLLGEHAQRAARPAVEAYEQLVEAILTGRQLNRKRALLRGCWRSAEGARSGTGKALAEGTLRFRSWNFWRRLGSWRAGRRYRSQLGRTR
jgi:hypothetical protein